MYCVAMKYEVSIHSCLPELAPEGREIVCEQIVTS